MRWLLLLAAACGHEEARTDAAARQLDIDVTVGHPGVTVYMNGTDASGTGYCDWPSKFPQVGGRTEWGDVGCWGTCMTEAVVWVDGSSTPGDPRFDPVHIGVDVTASSNALLELEGCGAIVWIPIGGFGAPTPTQLSAAQTGAGTIAVSWSADGPAKTALLSFLVGYGAELVHVPGTSYTFTPQSRPIDQYWSVSVQAFGTMSFLETPFGIVKIWPGGDWTSGVAISPSTPN